jgi:hypothetical protein
MFSENLKGRGAVSSRPTQMVEIAEQLGEFAREGFVLYSEGVGDDVNKFAFVASGSWGDDAATFLADYERVFQVPAVLLKNLVIMVSFPFVFFFFFLKKKTTCSQESNWIGPVSLAQVSNTFSIAQNAWNAATGSFLMLNFRLQIQVYRAGLDLFVAESVQKQKASVETATTLLKNATPNNVIELLREAQVVLQEGLSTNPPEQLLLLAGMLYQGVGLQLG